MEHIILSGFKEMIGHQILKLGQIIKVDLDLILVLLKQRTEKIGWKLGTHMKVGQLHYTMFLMAM